MAFRQDFCSRMTKVLILHDSPDYGGHERMFLNLLPALDSARFEVTACVPAANEKLANQIRVALPRSEVQRWPFLKRRGEPYLRYFRWRYRRHVRRTFATIAPDVVLLVQGRIENLAVPLSALPVGARIVSYLPMAHRIAETRQGDILGDGIRRGLYRRPTQFIVPSAAVADQVRRAGGTAPVAIVDNVIDAAQRLSKVAARNALNLPLRRKIALFMGRLEPRQKGIDILLDALRRAEPASFAEWTILFVGDGPSRASIENAAKRMKIELKLIPWTDQPDLYLSAADVLLLPSRWEGLPLVMLEALQHGVPILASNIDVYRASLPPSAIVDFATVDLARALEQAVCSRWQQVEGTPVRGDLKTARLRFAEALECGVRS
jgi:glycosyltransferase involved in cell wall biosynthesis